MSVKYFGRFHPLVTPLASIFACVRFKDVGLFWVCSSIVEEGLSYRFHASWPFVLQILGCFYRVAGKQAHPIMVKVTSAGLSFRYGICLY